MNTHTHMHAYRCIYVYIHSHKSTSRECLSPSCGPSIPLLCVSLKWRVEMKLHTHKYTHTHTHSHRKTATHRNTHTDSPPKLWDSCTAIPLSHTVHEFPIPIP